MKTIAILGSTGHIAKGLIEHLAGAYELALYSRSQDRPFGLFPYEPHDVVINCIGPREKLWTEPYEIFRIAETFDNMVLDYMEKHPGTLYISFSSGAVFGGRYARPVAARSMAAIDVNRMDAQAFYGIAKLNAEAKHRAFRRRIVDLRVFSYFSKHLSPDSLCLMNEVLSCIRDGRELVTSNRDFNRDYVHPNDLAWLVRKVIERHDVNAAFDVYSRAPVGKFELLEFFAEQYGLRFRGVDDPPETSPTGPKQNYYSINRRAEDLGYFPRYTSMMCIMEEASIILATDEH